jgi:hypothetical protein
VLDEIIKCIGQLSTIVTTTIFKTNYVQGIYVQGAGTQEKPYYAHSASMAGWSQVLERWEKPGAFAVSDKFFNLVFKFPTIIDSFLAVK